MKKIMVHSLKVYCTAAKNYISKEYLITSENYLDRSRRERKISVCAHRHVWSCMYFWEWESEIDFSVVPVTKLYSS